MSIELKPCPFDGHKAIMIDDYRCGKIAICTHCGVRRTEWNTRHEAAEDPHQSDNSTVTFHPESDVGCMREKAGMPLTVPLTTEPSQHTAAPDAKEENTHETLLSKSVSKGNLPSEMLVLTDEQLDSLRIEFGHASKYYMSRQRFKDLMTPYMKPVSSKQVMEGAVSTDALGIAKEGGNAAPSAGQPVELPHDGKPE